MCSCWHWYVARPHEIFLDLDSRRALTRALSVLRRAITYKYAFENRLAVQSIWLYPTESESHTHLILVLAESLPFVVRVAWSLWMGGDQIRAAYVMERLRRGIEFPELIATRREYEFRPADLMCKCSSKHKRKNVTDQCPALKEYLGDQRSADYFPRNLDRVEREPLLLPWGRVSKRRLIEWR